MGSQKLFLPWARRLLPALLWDLGVFSVCTDTDLQCCHFPFHLPLPGCSINRLLKVKPWFIRFVQCSVTWFTVSHHHEPLHTCKCLVCFTMSKKTCSYLKGWFWVLQLMNSLVHWCTSFCWCSSVSWSISDYVKFLQKRHQSFSW